VIRRAAEVEALDFPSDIRLGLAVQTTYSVDEAAEVTSALHSRFRNVARPAAGDICYATTNRQAAVRAIAARADAMIVAGESFSSNACRLAELASSAGCPQVQRVTGAEELDWSRLPRSGSVGITAAASTPESVVTEILDALRANYRLSIEEVSAIEETTQFKRVAIG
jgi:4-hydroxy-3-methylbut-2-enyl diphosphate reductase